MPDHLTNKQEERKREIIKPRTPPDAFIDEREMRVTDSPRGILRTKLQLEHLKKVPKRKRIDMLATPRPSIAMLSLVDLDLDKVWVWVLFLVYGVMVDLKRQTRLLLVQTLRVDLDGVVYGVVVGLEEVELDEDTKSCKACRKSLKRCMVCWSTWKTSRLLLVQMLRVDLDGVVYGVVVGLEEVELGEVV